MAKGDPATPPTQTTTAQMSPEQRQLFDLAMPRIREYAASVPLRYQGSTVAGFDPSQTQGQNTALGAARAQGELATSGAEASNRWLGANALDVGNDPIVQGAVSAATRPIYTNLSESALPSIRSEAAGVGPYGGSRQGIAEGLAIGKAGQTAGDVAKGVVSDAYQTKVKAQMQALGLLPQTQQAQLSEGTTQSGVGDVRQQQAQRVLDEQAQNYYMDQYGGLDQARNLMALLGGIPGGTNTTTGSLPPQTPLWQRSLGGAAAGATLGSALMPGVGTAVGGAGGALLPFLLA